MHQPPQVISISTAAFPPNGGHGAPISVTRELLNPADTGSPLPQTSAFAGPGEENGILRKFLSNGPLMLFASSFCFAWMAISVRALTGFSASETTFLRFIIGLVILFILHRATLLPLIFVNRKLLLLRGVLGALAVTCYFTCIRKTDAATATLLNNSYPLFALVTGFALGTVRIEWRLVALLFLSLTGMFVVINPGSGFAAGSGALYGVASAAFAGAALIVIEKARSTDSAQATFASMCLGGVAIGLVGMIFGGGPLIVPGVAQWGWILLLGISSTIAQLLMNHALLYVGATEGSVVTVTTTAFTALFAWAVFGDRPGWNFYLGAAFILTSAVIAGLSLARRKSQAETVAR